MDSDFFSLPQEVQKEELASFSRTILANYALEADLIECVSFEYNTTMKITAIDGREFALRININSPRTIENLRAEIAWVQYLEKDSRVRAPQLVAAKDGSYLTEIFHEKSGRTLRCVLYVWLPGVEPDEDQPDLVHVEAMGRSMALMHTIAQDFELPSDSNLPQLDDVMWWTEDFLLSEKSVLDSASKDLISKALTTIADHVAQLYVGAKPIVIHADLHGGNVLWNDGSLSVIDFDDCGVGLPIQDLATAMYYLDTPEQDAAFLKGYSSVLPLPKMTWQDEAVLRLQRRIILLNYLYETSNLEHRSVIPEYLEETMRRVSNFLAL
jgi:Ser/Thr protein kinase RdoA (MazF antagonist)